jgi:predicted transcriptional regulator YdeE
MEGSIEVRPRVILAGLSFYGNPFARSAGWTEGNEIGALWSRFMRMREDAQQELPAAVEPDFMYELHIPDAQTGETGEYEVFIGYRIEEVALLPLGLLAKVVPEATFARFTVTGNAIVETDTYSGMYSWIAGNNLEPAAEWMYNRYNDRFKGMDRLEESAIDVFIPVRDQGDADG